MDKEHRGFLFGFLAAVSSALSALFIKFNATIPNETLVFARFSICLLCILPTVVRSKVSIQWRQFKRHLLRALAGLASIYAYFYSVEQLPLVNAITLFNVYALWVPLVIFLWMRVTIPLKRVLGIVWGFVGVLFILRPTGTFSEWATFVGLLGSLFSAIAIVGVRQLAKTEKLEEILMYYFLIAVAVSFIPMILTWEPIETPFGWMSLALIGVLSFAFQYCLTQSLIHAPASKVSTLSYTNVLFSGLLGWWLFGEVPTYWILAGTVCIIGGGLIALFSSGKSRSWK